jgi:hypothetical protein
MLVNTPVCFRVDPTFPKGQLNSGRLLASTTSRSHSTPMPGVIVATAMPFSIRSDVAVSSLELRDVLDVSSIGHRAGEADVQLSPEVRAQGQVERLGHMHDLEHGVTPPMRAASTCTIEQALLAIYSRICRSGMSARARWPA